MSNELELEFAKYLSDINKPVWIRQVLIPGITDSEEDLLKLRDFLGTLNNVEKVEILPYHDLGKFKWENLGLQYSLDEIRNATQDDVNRAKTILRTYVRVSVGTEIFDIFNVKNLRPHWHNQSC